MNDALVYLSIVNGKNRLVISGSYEVFQNFVHTFTQDAQPITPAPIYNPKPEPITEEVSTHDR